MKNLANCKPSEFLVQTNKIRKAVGKWLTDTRILDIRRRLPVYEQATPDMSAEEKVALIRRNKELLDKQSRENLSSILDAMLDEYPEETLEILALLNFTDLEHIDDYSMSDILASITELINNEAVLGFFTSLASLANSNISTT